MPPLFLNEHVIAEILIRLPAKEIARLLYVCKQWLMIGRSEQSEVLTTMFGILEMDSECSSWLVLCRVDLEPSIFASSSETEMEEEEEEMVG